MAKPWFLRGFFISRDCDMFAAPPWIKEGVARVKEGWLVTTWSDHKVRPGHPHHRFFVWLWHAMGSYENVDSG